MKARVKSTGEIIEVKEWRGASDVIYSTLDMNMFYADNELEVLIEKDATTLKGWACRDKDGSLTIFYNTIKPSVEDNDDYWSVPFGFAFEYLPKDMFPDLKFDNSPRKVQITINEIEE